MARASPANMALARASKQAKAARGALITSLLTKLTNASSSLRALPSTPDGPAGSDIFTRLQSRGSRSSEDLLHALHLVWGAHLAGAGIPLGEITQGVQTIADLFLSVQVESGGLAKASAAEGAEFIKWLSALTKAIEDRVRLERVKSEVAPASPAVRKSKRGRVEVSPPPIPSLLPRTRSTPSTSLERTSRRLPLARRPAGSACPTERGASNSALAGPSSSRKVAAAPSSPVDPFPSSSLAANTSRRLSTRLSHAQRSLDASATPSSQPTSKRRRVERKARVDSADEEEGEKQEEEGGANELSGKERDLQPGQAVLAFYPADDRWWPLVVLDSDSQDDGWWWWWEDVEGPECYGAVLAKTLSTGAYWRWFAPEDIKPLDRPTKVPTGLTAGDQDLYEKGLAIANNKKKLKSWFAKPTRLERELKRVFDAEAEEALGGRA